MTQLKKNRVWFFPRLLQRVVLDTLPKTPTSGCRGDFWSKNVFLILACNDTIKKKCIGFITKHNWITPFPLVYFLFFYIGASICIDQEIQYQIF